MRSSRPGYQRDLKRCEFARGLSQDMRRGNKRARRSLLRAIPPGLYEHWKSDEQDQKFYLVRGVEIDGNQKGEPEVSYMALYLPYAADKIYRVLLDHEEGFLAPIWRPQRYVGPRFRLIQRLDPVALARIEMQAWRLAQFKRRQTFLEEIRELKLR